MNKQIYGRFQQKHDTEANWLKATNFAPLEGELIIYDADENHDYPRFKVGIWDGTSEKTDDMLVSNLPFEGGYTNEEIDALLKNLNSENITVKQTGLGTTTIGPGTLDLLDSENTTVFSIDSEARVEGGVTDKDMIKEMVGSLGSLTTLTPAVANESMSLAFGANNNTYAPGTVSFGVNVSAGTKAYYYDAITFGDKPTIQLATTRRSSTYKAPSYPSSVTWEKGDRVTIKTKNYNHVCAGVIESVSGNTITLSAALPFTEIDYTAILGTYVYTMPHDRTIVNIDKPEAGVLSLGFGAIAMGGGASGKTKAVGMLSTALGYETEALGSFALSAGKNTKAAYASIALGAGAEAMGETSAAFGTTTKANGAYSVAAGKNTVASGGASTAFGVDSQATKWGAFAVGSAAIAEGQGAIALGNNVKATNTSAVAVGHITKATGVGAFAAGNSTEATAEGAFAEGTYSKATATGAHAEGGGENADVATTATAAYAHGEGYRTHAKGAHSHTEGALTETIGASSHAEGEGSIAHASRSHAGGYKAITYGANSFAHGDQAQTGEQTVLDTYYSINVNPENAQIVLDNTAELFAFRKTVVNSKIYPFEYNGTKYQVHITNDAGLDLYWNPTSDLPPEETSLLWQSDIAVNSCPAVDDDGYYYADQAYFECDSSLINQVSGGDTSAAFGRCTQAQGNAQFVTGMYNVPDTTSAFIIGNGTSSKRENIHTVDWSGNAWYKGDITAGSISLQTTANTADQAKTTASTALANARQAGIRYTDMSLSNLFEGGLVGLQAKGSARYGMALGWGCEVTGSHGMAFGACTQAAAGQTAVGKANKSDQVYGSNNLTPIFMVGNGSTDTSANATSRSNAFAVLSDGTGYLGDKKILVEGDVTNSGEVSGDITVNTIAIGDIGQTTIGAFTASFAGDVAISGTVKPVGILIENNTTIPAGINIFTSNDSGHVSLSNSTWGTGFTVNGYGTASFGTDEDYGSGVTIYGFNGEIEADNSITASNYITASAGITEMYEWTDGNVNDEDRRGLFITLDGSKIRVANENDNYILGVIDPNPSLIGDAAGLEWKDKYLKDVFGSYIYEEVEVPATYDEEGNVLTETTIRKQKVLNPKYDETQEYISRTDRKEFAAITSKGKVVMIDDGTCIPNGYATVGANGQATYSSDNYAVRVLERIDKNHIKVLIDSIFIK